MFTWTGFPLPATGESAGKPLLLQDRQSPGGLERLLEIVQSIEAPSLARDLGTALVEPLLRQKILSRQAYPKNCCRPCPS